jgi:transcriptional regulator with XRE-family HTH domain
LRAATFGQLVKELRKTTSDHQGNRWTRETLSKQIHLSVDQLGRLERGDRKYYDNQSLELLADAFKLTPIERKEFFITAAGITDQDYCFHLTPDEQLQELIETLGDVWTPAFLLDAYQDIVAINKSCLDLFMINDEIIISAKELPFGYNLLKYMYDQNLGFAQLLGPLWQDVAMIQIHQFRRTSFRFQHHDYYKQLMNELSKEPKFDIDWYTSQRDPINKYLQYEKFSYIHPIYGPLRYIATEANTESIYGELQLILYLPADFPTAATFYQLVNLGAQKAIRLAEWPIK